MHHTAATYRRSAGVLALLTAVVMAANPAGAGGTPPPSIDLHVLGTHATGLFNGGAAEIAAYDSVTHRLFVVNGAQQRIDVLDINDPTLPTLAFSINVTPYGHSANSVAVHGGIVAAAVQNEVKTSPGKAVFFDADGTFLSAVTVGALPDMITFTPDGSKVLVANEAEPNDDYTIDPEGSVSIIDVSGGVGTLTDANVTTAGFAGFDRADLDPSVRIFGRGASVAQDMEPEYIAVDADSSRAWVTLQENNAIGLLDLAAGKFTRIVGLGFKDHATGTPSLKLSAFTNLPVLGTTEAGEQILLGGFSGLYFDGVNASNGNYKFITHPDRGPNAEPVDLDGDGVLERPFPLPNFQPELVFFELNPMTGVITITSRMGLRRGDGTPLTGRSNLMAGAQGMAYSDEKPIDLFGHALPLDPYGADLEGVVRSPDGSIWMCDEYRPSIYHFTAAGLLLARYVPEGSNDSGVVTGVEALPAVYAQRRTNRGFEGIAYQHGKIYAFIQSPLDNPDIAADSSSISSRNNRILEFDIATASVTGEYLYRIEGGGSDKIGDAVSMRPGEFLVVERDASLGAAAKKKIFHINLAGATNLHMLPDSIVGPGGTLELMTAAQLDAAGIKPVAKELYVDLAAIGFAGVEKIEGLAMIQPGLLAVLNDNDFQMSGSFNPVTGLLTPNTHPQPAVLGLIDFTGREIDASDKDTVVRFDNWPVFGVYMPDGIDAFTAGGHTWLITANEGDSRAYPGFNEEARVKSLNLDPVAFPTAADLKKDANLGRLNVTNTMGDFDGDGDYDALYAFGTRSFSIWSIDGAQVYDSGDQFERITVQAYPAHFNADNAAQDFDTRSDNKGPEPEGVAVGVINGHTYAFIGLERIGGVMVYDVSDPTAPLFVQYVNNRDFSTEVTSAAAGDLGPEGLLFIPAQESPTRSPLLVTANEISGTTTIYGITAVACAPAPADLDHDCVVGSHDLAVLIASWGPCPSRGTCPGDLNGSGAVNGIDLAMLLGSWGQ